MSANAPSALHVQLYGEDIGILTRLPGDVVTFDFLDSYVNADARPTLSWGYYDAYRQLRTKSNPQKGKIPPFFANLLPEADLRRYVAYRASLPDDDEFGLLWVTGDDLPGAVTAHDPQHRPVPPSAEGRPENEPLAADLLRFSLAGVQLKFSALENAVGGLTIRAHGQGGDRVIKMPSVHFEYVPENEFAMLQFARAVGIEVPEMRLIDVDRIVNLPEEAEGLRGSALSLNRFDRPAPDLKVHIEDMNQVFRQYPLAKYDNRSFANLAETIYQAMGNDELIKFVHRLVFNVGVGNNDMHLKNWSLIYPDRRTPRLSPAYDFVCTKVYLKHNQTGLALGSARYFPQVTTEQFEHMAKRAGVSVGIVREAAADMVGRMRQVWPTIRGDMPFPALTTTIDEQFNKVPLFNPKASSVVATEVAEEPPQEIA
jgi:serine/threonine-protein kinase HipA